VADRGVGRDREKRASTLVLAGLLLATLAAARAPAQVREAAGRERAAAAEAYERRDFAAFLAHSQALVDLLPTSATARYNLACALSLTGDATGAVAALEWLAQRGVAFDVDADSDLDPVRAAAGFPAVAARMRDLARPLGDGDLAFTVPEKDLLAEGVAYDPRTGAFFVTGVHRRKIVRVDASGRARDFVPEARDGLCSAQAAVADPARRALWVSSGCSPLAAGAPPEERGRSWLLEYDLDDATLRRRLAAPVAGGRVSDLALGPDGTLYAADDGGGRVYALGPKEDALRVLVAAGPLVSPQGLAVSSDGRDLFVADYTRGIARVDLATGTVALLPAPDDVLLTGIDGLVLAGDSLVGIQNGLRPHRIVRVGLDPERTRVLGATVLARALPEWDEPTLGVLVGSDLYYVANSQYRLFADDGTPDLARLRPPMVLRLRLSWMR
jgi:sugar lactone lactonase YvrE